MQHLFVKIAKIVLTAQLCSITVNVADTHKQKQFETAGLDVQKGGHQLVQNKRVKIHGRYYKIKAMQQFMDISDIEMAEKLSMSVRTYNDKVYGWLDFDMPEYLMLKKVLNLTLEQLAETRQGEMS